MFNCQNCGETSKPNQPLGRVAIKRESGPLAGTIERELHLCPRCKEGVEHGIPLQCLRPKAVPVEPIHQPNPVFFRPGLALART